MSSGSWIVVWRSSGEAVLEIFDATNAKRINETSTFFKAVPAMEYLQEFNRRVKEEGLDQ